jgi:hypothetical protein
MSLITERFRDAIDQQIELWHTLTEIEHLMGVELNGLDELIRDIAAAAPDGDSVDEDEIVETLTLLAASNSDRR